MAEEKNEGHKFSRRDILKGIAGAPVVGSLWFASWHSNEYNQEKKKKLQNILDIKSVPPPPSGSMEGDIIRLGIIGVGIRGEQLMRASGFASPYWIEQAKEKIKENKNVWDRNFFEQEDLNVRFTAVCDLFDVHLEIGEVIATTDDNKPKLYKDYQDLLADPNVDAVIIATPDHWHAPISMDAIRAGKHVYVEKCMTHKVVETFKLAETVADNPKVVFAVGHQHRQTESFLTAQDIIQKNVLGHVNLVQANTNRNDDNGAWQYNIHPDANENTIDWKRFLGPMTPDIPFNKEHFFRWRKWWPYGTGLSGDLLTHDFDRINTVLGMGLPSSVMASGGVYTHRDGREVPDVLQVAMEFPDYFKGGSQEKGKEKGMTFLYSASLGSNYNRPTVLMGHDASMELGSDLTVRVAGRSTQYKEYIESGVMGWNDVIYSYAPGGRNIDGVTSATSKYFADKGLMYTYRGGKKVDSTHLHIREWLSCIRHGGTPSCGIKEGFDEAISALMSAISYKTGKRATWDQESLTLGVDGESYSHEDLDTIIMQSEAFI